MDSTEQFLSGGGEMGALIRTMDWSATPLGPVSSWPQSLRTSVSLCLSSTFPILIAWGPETIQIYNDSYRPICGAKHPESMGQNFRICWATALPVVGDAFTRGQHGEGTYIKDQRMFLDRYGYLEEAFMTFSFAPIRDESGEVGGIFHPITESTEKMLSARRTNALRRISAAIGSAREQEEIVHGLTDLYQEYLDDCPFMLLYTFAGPATLKLVCSTGLPARSDAAPAVIYTDKETPLHTEGWSFTSDMTAPLVLNDIRERFADLASGSYPETPASACIYPVRLTGRTDIFGYLVAGVSARRAMDDEYTSFYDQLSATVNTAFSSVDAFEQEARKAAELAAIDQAKTAFFNNVSHEFRTPLTLMTGPVEELMAHPSLQTQLVQEPLQTIHRNALRLLRLVNNLLDFSRQEAGRVQASFHPTDLAVLTSDLAGSFRSLVEKAGLQLQVEISGDLPLVYADPVMWEKIVLNLLSNAFKFTLQGSITVQLYPQENEVILQVKDTGAGIPPEHLPRMFERFHRIQGSAGRSFEGSGIGLSLVKELVQQHAGVISVESEWEQGSCFTVGIPLGKAHLPADKIDESPGIAQHSAQTLPFLQEAAGMLHAAEATPSVLPAAKKGSVLITDDNADMRAYLVRLLSPHYDLQVAVNGLDALEKLSEYTPDIVVSDIMMPLMDGRELLRRMRIHPMWSAIPVIFLSARAGDEAKVEGLEAGADDYLVKPFSATELLSRVRIQVNIARKRSLLETTVKRYSHDLFTAQDDLGRQQEELRQFAFVSSHNLQEPLRKIRLFAGMLKAEFNTSDTGKQESFALSRITQSAEQLSGLITDLLAFAQLGFDYSQKATVDLNKVWLDILLENREWIITTKATVHTEKLPTLHAVPEQMHLLLTNLLTNALKFHRGEPQVTIQYHIAGDNVVIVFSDRGIGFEETQADKIFDVFQRLHAQDQYTGTGIGLSMCKKIVTAHGGTISVRSKPDAGSTFYISLPASMLIG